MKTYTLAEFQDMSNERLNALAASFMGWEPLISVGQKVISWYKGPEPSDHVEEWSPATDRNHAAELEAEIDELGLWEIYQDEVAYIILGPEDSVDRETGQGVVKSTVRKLHKMTIRLSARERTIAALMAVQESE